MNVSHALQSFTKPGKEERPDTGNAEDGCDAQGLHGSMMQLQGFGMDSGRDTQIISTMLPKTIG